MVVMGRPSKAIKWVDFPSKVSSGSMMGACQTCSIKGHHSDKALWAGLKRLDSEELAGPMWPEEPVRAEGSTSQARLAGSAFPSVGREVAPTSLLITKLN